jgi:hypothetical protein
VSGELSLKHPDQLQRRSLVPDRVGALALERVQVLEHPFVIRTHAIKDRGPVHRSLPLWLSATPLLRSNWKIARSGIRRHDGDHCAA